MTRTPTSGLKTFQLGKAPWQTFDPFLFCAFHKDDYPEGNGKLEPQASLQGRNLGRDFAGKDGWSMYHGRRAPGFPRHPHRGFETITVTRRGVIDHSDSLGASARYGEGDVQWMTAGNGIEHAEMFPLIHEQKANPLELFQIWLNLPARSKRVSPFFSMTWSRDVPRLKLGSAGSFIDLTLTAGRFGSTLAPAAPPNSWASFPESQVAIWSARFDEGAVLRLPDVDASVNRTLYLFKGGRISIQGVAFSSGTGIRLPNVALELRAEGAECEILMLQGREIGEPVVKQGPFVMNSREEIQQAYLDYRETRFGAWPWASSDPVHAPAQGHFARHADGRLESSRG